ncbi:MAG: hypothetical protein KF838_10015 [Phycisphaeraceae bacterium]|nr:MAG: hypothetical protein KF838_10015 [Phycisphaeraceae bacterium]
MSILGSSIAQSVAGSAQAERVAARDAEKAKEQRPRACRTGKDEFERHVTEVETVDAVESQHDQERREQPGERGSRDPRTAHAYDATGHGRREDAAPSIDLRG